MDITVNTVTVDGPVDATVLSSQVSGNEDGTIALNLGPIAAIDGTETIGDLLIGNVPEGTSFSSGTDNGDGTWTIPLADVTSLTMTPPAHSDDDFNLTTAVTFTDGNSSLEFSGLVEVTVAAVADPVQIVADDATGTVNSSIPLTLSASLIDADGTEEITSIIISGVPSTATLNKGTLNGDGTYTVTQDDLSGLTVTATTADDINITMTVTNVDTDTETGAQSTNTTADSLVVTVDENAGGGVDDLKLQHRICRFHWEIKPLLDTITSLQPT